MHASMTKTRIHLYFLHNIFNILLRTCVLSQSLNMDDENKVTGEKNVKRSRLENSKRLLRYAKPEANRICIGLTALVVNGVTNLSFPWIMGRAVDEAATGGTDGVVQVAIRTGSIFMIGSVASWLRVYCLGTATDLISSRMRGDLFNSFIDKDMDFYDASKTGELVSVLEKDVQQAAEGLTEKLAAGLRSLNSSVNGSVLLFMTSPRLCAVSLGIVPLIGIGAMSASKYARKLAAQLRSLESKLLSFALERFAHITTVRLNGREQLEKETFAEYVSDCIGVSQNSHFAQGAFMGFINVATNASLFAVLCVGGGLIAKGKMTAGSLTRFALQSAFVGLGFSGLSNFHSDMIKAVDAAGRVFEAMDIFRGKTSNDASTSSSSSSSTSVNSSMTTTTTTTTASSISSDNTAAIEFSKVSFSYKLRPDISILSNLSLTLQPRSIHAIIGNSGSGKSSMMALLCGLYRPNEGSIFIDDVNLLDADLTWIRSKVGVVQQNVGLLSGTIASNIAYGKEGATQDDIVKAAKAAFAHDFIVSFPHGYDTQIGENGSLLSGGQAARVGIARALVKDPSILLLDEATAALDSSSEMEIIQVLKSLSTDFNKTIVVFTHSEHLMKAANFCHVLEDKKISWTGSFSSLPARYLSKV